MWWPNHRNMFFFLAMEVSQTGVHLVVIHFNDMVFSLVNHPAVGVPRWRWKSPNIGHIHLPSNFLSGTSPTFWCVVAQVSLWHASWTLVIFFNLKCLVVLDCNSPINININICIYIYIHRTTWYSKLSKCLYRVGDKSLVIPTAIV